jgi:hypothetical protein
MSICNVEVWPTAAIVVADTRSQDIASGNYYHRPKLVPIVHWPAVVGGRGSIDLMHQVGAWVLMECIDFDSARAALGGVVPEIHRRLLDAGMPKVYCEIVLVGWSAELSRFVCDLYILEDDAWRAAPATGSSYAPNKGIPPVFSARSADDLVALARLQTKACLDADPAAAIGGRYVVVEMHRDVMSVRTLD